MSDEVNAMNRVAYELDRLDADSQRRILVWAWAKYYTDRPQFGPLVAAASARLLEQAQYEYERDRGMPEDLAAELEARAVGGSDE